MSPNTLLKIFSLPLQLLRPKRELGADLYLPGSHVIPGGEGDSSEWSEWSAPSACSRTCGGGVSHKTRQCLNLDQHGRALCQGGDKLYFSCSTQVNKLRRDSHPFPTNRFWWSQWYYDSCAWEDTNQLMAAMIWLLCGKHNINRVRNRQMFNSNLTNDLPTKTHAFDLIYS